MEEKKDVGFTIISLTFMLELEDSTCHDWRGDMLMD